MSALLSAIGVKERRFAKAAPQRRWRNKEFFQLMCRSVGSWYRRGRGCLWVMGGVVLGTFMRAPSVSSGVPRCLTPIPYRIHQDPFVPARSALEGALFEARSLRRDACNPHVFAAYRTRTACDWKLGLDGGLRCVHGYYPHVLLHQNIALRSKAKSVQYCAFGSLMEIGREPGS